MCPPDCDEHGTERIEAMGTDNVVRCVHSVLRWQASVANLASQVITGTYAPGSNYFGFILANNALSGECCDGDGFTNTGTLATVTTASNPLLEAVLTPGVSVKFYIDGAYAGQSTTNIPSGTDSGANYLYVGIVPAEAASKNVYVGEFLLNIDPA